MNAVLSGETATAAVPAGQPEPLTVATLITILSGGTVSNGGCAYAWEVSVEANNAATTPPAYRTPGMILHSMVDLPARWRGPPCWKGYGHSFQARWYIVLVRRPSSPWP